MYKYNKISNDKSKEIVKSLFNYSKGIYIHCTDCKNNCLKTPLKNISFKSLIDKGFQLDILPPKLQRETCIIFFYIEFINGFVSTLDEELCKEMDGETANEIGSTLYWSLNDYVSENCSDQCNNECIIEHSKNAYCKFCCFASKKLPCPKEAEISYESIKASEEDMAH